MDHVIVCAPFARTVMPGAHHSSGLVVGDWFLALATKQHSLNMFICGLSVLRVVFIRHQYVCCIFDGCVSGGRVGGRGWR